MHTEQSPKILIVKTSSLGDIVHAMCVLPYLKNKFPNAEIDWVVEDSFKDLVQAHPLIDNVITIHAKKWKKHVFSKTTWKQIRAVKKRIQEKKYDEIFDLQGNIKSAICTFFAKGKKIGFSLKSIPEWPAFFVLDKRYHPPKHRNIREDYLYILQAHYRDVRFSLESAEAISLEVADEDKILVEQFLQGIPGPKLLVAPGAQWKNKKLREDALENCLQKLCNKEKLSIIFIWGTAEEKRFADRMNRVFPSNSFIFAKSSLPTLMCLMNNVDMVFAADSLPLHLCGMTKTPSFSIFGPSSQTKYCPVGSQHKSEQGSCPYGEVFEKRCRYLRTCSTGLCTRGYTGDSIFEAFYPHWKSYCSR